MEEKMAGHVEMGWAKLAQRGKWYLLQDGGDFCWGYAIFHWHRDEFHVCIRFYAGQHNSYDNHANEVKRGGWCGHRAPEELMTAYNLLCMGMR
jgi:hypothetical protein